MGENRIARGSPVATIFRLPQLLLVRLEDLNPPQQQAVRTTKGPVLILAGAGTGKTRVITTRICHLLKQGVPPEKILAVTFTNKAANEMRERVGKITPRGTTSKITISTFHSLCVKILRAHIDLLGYKRNFTIYTGSDQAGLVKKIIVKKAGKDEKLQPEMALGLYSRERNKGVPMSDMADALVVEVMRDYQRQLKLLNAVDFDDLLVLSAQILKENADVRKAWQARYEYLMVDEFQDTNSLQMELVQMLTGPHQNICVVGDDDQSIYGWRGAEISNILEFERHFSNPTVVTLEENYRSTTTILDAANGLIRHNRNRRAKKLWSKKEGVELVRVIGMPGENEEAEFIVEELAERQREGNLKWEDIAILFRTNTQTRVFEETMRKLKIPYRVVGGQSFFDRREIKDVIAYLQILANPNDDVNLLRIINNPPRGLGDTLVEQATAESARNREAVMETLRRPEFLTLFSTKTQGAVKRFCDLMENYRLLVKENRDDLATLADRLLREIEYIPYLKRTCKDEEEGASREQNVKEFLSSLHEQNIRNADGLADFLGSIALDDSRESASESLEKKSGVSLITMHAAKGLEFPVVYLPGLEEGILPHKRSVEEGTRDEERRLLYVGITRAQKHLTLSYCATRTRWGDKLPCMPSSFIKELNPECIERTSYAEICSAPVDDEAAEFEKLKKMLAGM